MSSYTATHRSKDGNDKTHLLEYLSPEAVVVHSSQCWLIVSMAITSTVGNGVQELRELHLIRLQYSNIRCDEVLMMKENPFCMQTLSSASVHYATLCPV